ncbi:MAG: DUF2510 domain-containing protein [Microbacteriaceae bacterium]|nr:DUF2510 domain-containing protein [Microbacteriaceae bacterium]
MSTDSDDVDLDRSRAGWQPLLDRPGYERWWDGAAWQGRPHREPEPFSAFGPELARSLRPGPNRAAALARAGTGFTLLGFGLQAVVATGAVSISGVDSIALTLVSLALTAIFATLTALASVLAVRAAPRLGGRAIATLALGVSIVLGLAPVLLFVAIGLAGGI